MSLFKTREFWSTQSEDGEYFDQNLMVTHSLNGESNYIITGSHSGVLRIFKPSCEIVENEITGFVPTDLIVEKIFDQPILQIGCGRLVSGSLVYQIAVLNSRTLSVHLLKIKEGVTEHGTQNILELMYDHKLQRSAANFTIGQFGGSQNRDFICVQSLDGMLSFFEQEQATFSCFLPDFLLPGPLSYLKKADAFVTQNGDWSIVSFKYNTLCDSGAQQDDVKTKSTKSLVPVWCYNLGESVIDIVVVEESVNRLQYIVILGERNFFCLFDSGRLNFMKKLDYSPVCCEVYAINEKIYSLIISETSNLLIYENTTLKWSAKLQFLPICIRRAFLRHIQGALVCLSEEGRLECCYLGTEPNLFVAPPLVERELDLEKVEEELANLNKAIKDTYENDIKFTTQNPEKEINIKIDVNQNLERCTFDTNLQLDDHKMCRVNIQVTPKMEFDEVQILVLVSNPLIATPSLRFYTNPEDNIKFTSYIYVSDDVNLVSLSVKVIVTVISSLGVPKCFNKTAMLPLNLVMEACPAIKEAEHKITLNINQTVVPLLSLFPEFAEEITTNNAVAFKRYERDMYPVTILLAKSTERYRIQSSSLASLNIIVEQMIHRLKKHYSNSDDFKVSFNSALPSSEALIYLKEHFTKRKELFDLEDALDKLGAQFRIIQKRLISRYKDKNPTPLTNLEMLLQDTHTEISDVVPKLQEAHKALVKSQIELSCVLSLIGNLIRIMDVGDDLKDVLTSAFCPVVDDIESQAWEDVMDLTLCYLLKTYLAKSDKDKLKMLQTNPDKVTDIAKLEKHFVQVLERISKLENTSFQQEEDDSKEEPSNTSLNEHKESVGSEFGQASLRLLSARKSIRREHIITNEP